MALLNTILLPFQAGYENIITASGKPRELCVIKRIFENNHYRYDLQLDNSLFSQWGRVSIFAKGVALCLPVIGHITSIVLRCFSSSIFPDLPLDFAMKCSPKQKLHIAKCLYRDKPENVDQATRLTLAKILAADKEGLDILLANLCYLDLTIDPVFSLKIILENPKLIYQHYHDVTFAQQLFRLEKMASSENKLIIAQHFIDLPIDNILGLDLMENEEFALAIIKNNPEALKLVSDSEFSQTILNLLKNASPEDKLAIAKQFYLNQPEIDQYDRLALAEILAADKEGLDILLANLSYLDLMANPKFSMNIIQEKPELLDEIERYSPDFLKYLTENFNYCQFDNEEFALAIIQKKPEVLEYIKATHPQVAEQIFAKITDLDLQKILNDNVTNLLENSKSHITKQLLLKEAMDYKFIADWLGCLSNNQDLTKAFIKELISQTREVVLSDQMKLAIIHALITLTNNDFIEDLLKDQDINTTLANILLRKEGYHKLVINNIEYLDLLQNTLFNQELFQINPIPERVKERFFTQMLEQDPADPEFIVNWFNVLNFNNITQQELIKYLFEKIGSYSEQIEIAIAHVIMKKYPRGPKFLLDNIDKFDLSEEQRDNLLEKCTSSTSV